MAYSNSKTTISVLSTLWTLAQLYAAVYLPAREGVTFLWGQGWRVYIYVQNSLSF